jgi:hypothetical protein
LKATSIIKPNFVKATLWLAAVEGLAAFLFLFRSPSMARGVRFLGFSPTRLALSFALLLASFALIWAALRFLRHPEGLQRFCLQLDEAVLGKDRLLGFTLGLGTLFLVCLGLIILFSTNLSYQLQDWLFTYPKEYSLAVDRLRGVFGIGASALVWVGLLCLQALALLFLCCPSQYRRKARDGSLFRVALAALMLATAIFHWVVLIFQLKVFLVVHGWKWYFSPKDPSPNHLLFLVMFPVALGIIAWMANSLKHTRRKLLLLVLLGFGLQVGFGFMAGQGFESLRLKYADSIFNGYARAAAEAPDLYQALTHYEERYGSDTYLGTKPPGILLTYMLTEKVSNLVNPVNTPEARFVRLTTLAAYIFPLIAFLVIPALVIFTRRLLSDPEDSILPGLVYVVLPNVLLIPLFLDQALYPLLFILGMLLVLRMVEKPTFWRGLAVGAVIYGLVYMTFSLLPLLAFALLWLGISALRHRKEQGWRAPAAALLGIFAGLAVMFVLFLAALNYNFFVRYPTAMTLHHAILFNSRQEQILNAWVLDNVEMVTWIGFPVILLLFARAGRSLKAWVRGSATRLDELVVVFFASYAALLTLGKTNAETQRLFLFLVPLVALFSADEAKTLFKRKSSAFVFIAGLELITTLLIFLFQDFYG